MKFRPRTSSTATRLTRCTWVIPWACSLLLGCGAAQSTTVVRKLDGETTPGPFVSPHSYEWFIRGELAFAQEDYPVAAAAYRQALTGPDEDPLVLARLAEALAYTGDFAGAERALGAALAHDEASEAAWLAKGRIAIHLERPSEAMAAFEWAERAAPLSSRPPLALARLLESQGTTEQAIEVLERASARAGTGGAAPAVAELQVALAMTQRDGAALRRAARQLLAQGPLHAAFLRETARTLLSLQQERLAALLWQMIPATPEDAPHRLEAFLHGGEHTRAEGLLALYDTDTLGGIATVAQAYLTVGRPDLAEHLLAAHGDPEDPAHARLLRRAQAAQQVVYSDSVPSDSP